MNASTLSARQPLTRREVVFYFFFATLGLAVLVFALIVVWALIPASKAVSVGSVLNFPPSTSPYPIQVAGREVFLVNDGQSFIAIDPVIRLDTVSLNCGVRWQPESSYFEDPCWGIKFNLHGQWLSGPTRHLNYYQLEVRGQALWIDSARTYPIEPTPPSK